MAERVGVEPTSPVLPGYPLSRRALSTTQTPLRGGSAILTEAWRWGNAGPAKDLTAKMRSSDIEVTEKRVARTTCCDPIGEMARMPGLASDTQHTWNQTWRPVRALLGE